MPALSASTRGQKPLRGAAQPHTTPGGLPPTPPQPPHPCEPPQQHCAVGQLRGSPSPPRAHLNQRGSSSRPLPPPRSPMRWSGCRRCRWQCPGAAPLPWARCPHRCRCCWTGSARPGSAIALLSAGRAALPPGLLRAPPPQKPSVEPLRPPTPCRKSAHTQLAQLGAEPRSAGAPGERWALFGSCREYPEHKDHRDGGPPPQGCRAKHRHPLAQKLSPSELRGAHPHHEKAAPTPR